MTFDDHNRIKKARPRCFQQPGTWTAARAVKGILAHNDANFTP
jgi:hypothetical protein